MTIVIITTNAKGGLDTEDMGCGTDSLDVSCGHWEGACISGHSSNFEAQLLGRLAAALAVSKRGLLHRFYDRSIPLRSNQATLRFSGP